MDDNESYTDIEFGCPQCGGLDCDCQFEPANPFDRYRIRRVDPKNIAIQRFGDKQWNVISYHGNSASSLLAGVLDVMVVEHTPEGSNLPQQLEKLRLELVSSVTKVEKMIKEADCGV